MPISQADIEPLTAAVDGLVNASRTLDWKTLLTFAAGTVAATVGAMVSGWNARSAAEKDAERKELDRLRDKGERAQLSALRLAITIEAFGHQSAQWHAENEDDDDEFGGRVSSLPKLIWPKDVSWEALGIATANEALAFEIDVAKRKEHLESAFQYDGDAGLQLVPGQLLEVAMGAIRLAEHIRAEHKIGNPSVVKPSGWDWRKYVQDQMVEREKIKAVALAASELRRLRRAEADTQTKDHDSSV